MKNIGQNSKGFTEHLLNSLPVKLLLKSMGILPKQRSRNINAQKQANEQKYYQKSWIIENTKMLQSQRITECKSNVLLTCSSWHMPSLGLGCENQCLFFFWFIPFWSTFDMILLLCECYQCFFTKKSKQNFYWTTRNGLDLSLERS